MTSYKFKLYSNAVRSGYLSRLIDLHARLWNYCIKLHDKHYEWYGKFLTAYKLKKFLTKAKKTVSGAWIKELPSQSVQDVVERIDKACQRHFANKKIAFPSEKRIEKYKSNFNTQVRKQFHEMKLNNDFTETVRRQVFSSFEGLKKKIEEETEIILRDTQETLDNLNDLKTQKSSVSQKEMERLHNVAESASRIVQDAYAVRKVLTEQMDA